MRIHIPIAGVKRKLLIGSIVALPILGGGGAAYAATLHSGTATPASAVTQPAVTTTQGGDTPGVNDTPDTPGLGSSAEAPDTSSSGADGPGSHQDPNGVDVNHQFDGQE